MKNARVTSAKHYLQGLTMSSAMWLLAFSGCSSIEGAAQNHGVETNLQMSHTGNGGEKPSDQPEPDYEWFY
jgi:hypothetical protein